MRELHLFAGIGGGILGGMLLGHRCVGAAEIDPYCQQVLRARIHAAGNCQVPQVAAAAFALLMGRL